MAKKSIIDEIMEDLSEINGISFNQELKIIPTGIDLLDTIAGGGIPVGKLISIAGSPGGGKSTLVCKIASSFQKSDPQSLVFYVDSEQAMTKDRLIDLGCDPDRTLLLSDMITVEHVEKIVEKIVSIKIKKKMEEVPFVFIWDSESASTTEKQLAVDEPEKLMGFKARLLTYVLPKIAMKCNRYNITPILINQLRDKIALNMYQSDIGGLKGMGDKTITGGNVMKFLPFQLILVRPRENVDADKFGFSGVISEIKFIKNKNYIPHIKIDLVLDYTHGYSDFWTKYRMLHNQKTIKGTLWKTLDNYKDTKFRIKEAESTYNSNEEFKKYFDELYEEHKKQVTMTLSDDDDSIRKISDDELDDEDLEEKSSAGDILDALSGN